MRFHTENPALEATLTLNVIHNLHFYLDMLRSRNWIKSEITSFGKDGDPDLRWWNDKI